MNEFLRVLASIGIILVIGASISALFYHIKRRELFAGFIGGLVVAVIGAMIGTYVLNTPIIKIWEIFSNLGTVNVFAALIGAYIAVFIMNKLTHNKERKKY